MGDVVDVTRSQAIPSLNSNKNNKNNIETNLSNMNKVPIPIFVFTDEIEIYLDEHREPWSVCAYLIGYR